MLVLVSSKFRANFAFAKTAYKKLVREINMATVNYTEVEKATNYIKEHCAVLPKVGIILGSGLSAAVDSMQIESVISYNDVPYMKSSTNPAHPGKFVLGTFADKPTICMQGRIHTYEGYSAAEVAFPIFIMKLLGVEKLVITNAAGAINTQYSLEEFVLISDHINFMGKNPLDISIDKRLGIPHPDMTYAYSPKMRDKVKVAAKQEGKELKEGVYIGVAGPSFETPAEIRAFRILGADLVGMSTVPEVIAAASCGIEALGVSLVTNMAAGILDQELSIDDINTLKCDVPARLEKIIHAAIL